MKTPINFFTLRKILSFCFTPEFRSEIPKLVTLPWFPSSKHLLIENDDYPPIVISDFNIIPIVEECIECDGPGKTRRRFRLCVCILLND